MTGVAWWMHDSWEMVRRNLVHIRRTPELLLDVTLQPDHVRAALQLRLRRRHRRRRRGRQSESYVNFLMAGIFVQTVAFAGMLTGVLLANDLQKGMIDRFRSLPMSQSSVLTGAHVDRPHARRAGRRDHVGRGPGGRLPAGGRAWPEPAGDRHHAALWLRAVLGRSRDRRWRSARRRRCRASSSPSSSRSPS